MLDVGSILAIAANAGFQGNDLATAAAIALAESGGNPNDYNPETSATGGTPQGQGSYGLWQIYLKKHPEFAGQNLYDPQTNANAAYAVYSAAGGFSPWTTYITRAYQQYLPAVLSAMQTAGPPLTAPAPITIDASTGQVIDDGSIPMPQMATMLDPALFPSGATQSTTGIGTYLLLAGLALAALWIFEEAT